MCFHARESERLGGLRIDNSANGSRLCHCCARTPPYYQPEAAMCSFLMQAKADAMKEYGNATPRDGSLLHHLLRAHNKETGRPFSELEIMAQGNTFLLAGEMRSVENVELVNTLRRSSGLPLGMQSRFQHMARRTADAKR